MGHTMTKRDPRTPAESFRTDSHPVRTASQPLRIDAKTEFLSAITETRQRLSKSIEAMAIDAECPVSSMSDALAGKDGRNFAGHWLIAQGDEFIATFNAVMDERRGLTPQAKKANKARLLAELLRQIVEEVA